ncbi:MAG: radical SAM protein [candidate division WOR-3 bacterium]|nr:MAG: radical SAM protein [candidate division WOR-3 bacterium]
MPLTRSRIGLRRKKSWPFRVLGRAVIEATAHPEAGSRLFDLLLLPMRSLILRQQPPDRRRIWDDALSLLTAMWTSMLRAWPTRRMGEVLHDVVATYSDTVPGGSPGFLVISPGKACNLRCPDCYANSATEMNALDYEVLSRIVQEAKEKWSIRFFTVTGGEPLFYRSKGKGVLDLCAENQDCMFLMYTNGFLINRKVAESMAEVGNITPAVSVEGMRERTDARRGQGAFDKVLAAIREMHRAGVPFGLSLTASSRNSDELLDDEFVDFFFRKQRAAYAWMFHYMPMGRNPDPDSMPTPEQRMRLWKRSWELMRERRIMVVDFWTEGTVSFGCISGGRPGGYFAIDWNGDISPCVFFPYAAANINDIYSSRGSLTDVLKTPLFRAVREWQEGYGYRQKDLTPETDWLRPCPIRDHYPDALEMIRRTGAWPTDSAPEGALESLEYQEKMSDYGRRLAETTRDIWCSCYLRNSSPKS